jgi:hypothetical protein
MNAAIRTSQLSKNITAPNRIGTQRRRRQAPSSSRTEASTAAVSAATGAGGSIAAAGRTSAIDALGVAPVAQRRMGIGQKIGRQDVRVRIEGHSSHPVDERPSVRSRIVRNIVSNNETVLS